MVGRRRENKFTEHMRFATIELTEGLLRRTGPPSADKTWR